MSERDSQPAATDPEGLRDILAPGLSVIFCGLNPGLGAAREQRHFVNRSNRFWRVLHQSGFTAEQLDPSEDSRILQYGCGLTTVVTRPTVSAQEVKRHEYLDAAGALRTKIEQFAPRYVAFLGKAAFAAISGRREIAWGAQEERFGGVPVWVLPNTSGLNRAFSLAQLVQAFGELYAEVQS